jgi:hypothetical protein
MKFNPSILSQADYLLADQIIGQERGGIYREPDLVIAPNGQPYLYRWHIVPHNKRAGVFLHVQVKSDPERPLHDHPWDNMSTILTGGYDEIWDSAPWMSDHHANVHKQVRKLRIGDTVSRKASAAHRLLLPEEFEYTMTLFFTGPKIRQWGFWYPDGWRNADDVTRLRDGVSVHIGEGHSNE